ncbi:Monothiol glutaredoxin-S14, chloroplastic [Vitis vinifera]|uniref:Monothiol glutaredoxin-S14, chloroplastic n=1 Tax=Vitis vinifera TaxID=29760 RepID=A0A438EC53_VITVI|nr:Monothiol glutaredoxin-S14, chloroplastic [Vitis vinifera]
MLAALTPELKTTLDKVVTSNKVVLFMKGTKEFPQCGFSNTVVQILNSLNVPFETINILENEILRQGLKEYSNWPTFPQLYIEGEFFGGCDITVVILMYDHEHKVLIGLAFASSELVGIFIFRFIICNVATNAIANGTALELSMGQLTGPIEQKFPKLTR